MQVVKIHQMNTEPCRCQYADRRCMPAGIRRVALLDFDVHHGNGTQACVGNTVPSLATYSFQTPLSSGSQVFPLYKPWRDFDDADHILFARWGPLQLLDSLCTSLSSHPPHTYAAFMSALCMLRFHDAEVVLMAICW